MKALIPVLDKKTQESGYEWHADRYQSIFVSRNRWFVAATLLMGVAGAQALGFLFLLPLKTSVPFLIKEEISGAVTVIKPLSGDQAVTHDEAVRKYFVGKYIHARETYDPADLLESYRAVELMSESSEQQLFRKYIVTSNPQSPIVRYGQKTKRTVLIRSISFLNDQTAQVRFTTTERTGSDLLRNSDWIATLSFRFAATSSAEQDRLINPLGFLVTSYRIDQEVVL